MARLYDYRSVQKKLWQLKLNWRRGLTVQVLAPHPYNSTSFRWVYNKLETKRTKLARYDYRPKPAGWGNGGGGLERLVYILELDMYLTELQILAMRHPDHLILTDNSLSREVKTVLAGGRREFTDESGFRDIEIRTDYPGVYLFDYVYPDWADANGIIHPGGHRKITLWGKLTSLREDRIIESNEIEKTGWFDLADSLPGQFFDRAPERPYFSHVLSTLGGMLRAYRHERSVTDGFVPNIPKRVHPSWWYVYQVGRGDWRFPAKGYKPSPGQWYGLFETMVKNRMEEADNDFLVKFLGRDLVNSVRLEEEQSEEETSPARTQEVVKAIEGSEDSDRIPILEEMWQKEYEAEYLRWYEENHPSNLRATKTPAA